MSGIPTLPIELVEQIIDHLRGECRTLVSCALTHKSWYSRATMVLYTAIYIQSRAGYDVLRRRRFTGIGTSASISATQSLFSLTEELSFDESEKRAATHQPKDSLPGPTNPQFVYDVLPTFAGFPFPKLRHLTLRSRDVEHPSNRTRPSFNVPLLLSTTFSSVRSLVLDGQVFDTLRDFVRIICALPRLEELDTGNRHVIRRHTPSLVVTPTTGSQLSLHRLHVGRLICLDLDPGAIALLKWLLDTQTVRAQTLQVLKMTGVYRLSDTNAGSLYDTLSDVLKHLGPSLRHLDVEIRECEGVGLVLTHSIGLETLVLRVQANLGRFQWVPGRSNRANVILPILATLVTPYLRRLDLVVELIVLPDCHDEDVNLCAEQMDWSPFNSIIARAKWDGLEEVIVKLSCLVHRTGQHTSWELLKGEIRSRMERLLWHTRGILRIVYDTVEDLEQSPTHLNSRE
ncbi:hypothetical protein DAEQUDRAFT_811281 [Daedalea quercina L-15889]|uniref:F-box domain-containing protein n=1 Tax=Daedalea quercina L-15889 TaxID=1314783 RepID=A0A165QHY3_9APHY|nr:hypothetical protein DAEQUDRAFT_811281 [Daedalea quercina L-15889]